MEIKKLLCRKRRAQRVRNKLKANSRHRLSIFISNYHVYAQIIDDAKGETICAASTIGAIKEKKPANTSNAKEIGSKIAKIALLKEIKRVVFDRGHRIYHGKVKAVAEGAREAGLEC